MKKIEIKHFRSIFEEEIEDVNHLNIFGGQNDSGKSNVLRALNLFFNQETSFLEKFNFLDDFSMSSKVKARESKKGRQFISIKIYFDAEEIKGEKKSLKRLAIENGGLWVERRWWAYSETYEQIEPDYIKNASQGVKRSFSVFLQTIKFVYIPAFKSAEVFSYILKLSARNKGLFLSNTAKDELDKNIEKTTVDFSKDFQDITSIKTSVTLPISLESFWSSLEVNSQFEAIPEKITRGGFDDYKIKFTSRGEGIKSLFIPVVLGWLAKKAKTDHWIWGIDEPENALEATRVDNLFLKFIDYSDHAQVFVSTHSPSFLFPQKYKEKTIVFISVQAIPGRSTFQKIGESIEQFEKVFGYDYGSFLRIQEQYSESINEQERLKKEIEEFKLKKESILLFVEGESDKIILENAWAKLYPEEKIPFLIKEKDNAQQVAYALENADIFEKEFIFGLFDFDNEGYQRWNGLSSKNFDEDKASTPYTCLVRKKAKKNQYALMLPVPDIEEIKKQVISGENKTFGDKASLQIELLFYGVKLLSKNFIRESVPGGGTVIKFSGTNKIKFAKSCKDLNSSDFQNFKILFEKINEITKKP
jgi:AAA15 family ATPase/GTPase